MGKIDVIMKEFWRDNGRFADLFNAGSDDVVRCVGILEGMPDAFKSEQTKRRYNSGRIPFY